MNLKQPADGERRSEMATLGRDTRDGGNAKAMALLSFLNKTT